MAITKNKKKNFNPENNKYEHFNGTGTLGGGDSTRN
jgi:hypothetical protein